MDFGSATQLGAVGVALVIIWLMYKLSADERKRNDERLDARDASMRQLEADIRNKLSTQLMENTNAMLEYSKVMENVVKALAGIQNQR